MKKPKDDGIRYFTVKISVDEEVLREVRADIDESSFDINQAIINEFGWLGQSGISLESVKSAK